MEIEGALFCIPSRCAGFDIKEKQSLKLSTEVSTERITTLVKQISSSPARPLRLSCIVKQKREDSLYNFIPPSARSLPTLQLKEKIHHVQLLLNKKETVWKDYPKDKILNTALILATHSELLALLELGKLIFLLDIPNIDATQLQTEKAIDALFEIKLNETLKLAYEVQEEPFLRELMSRKMAKILITSEGLVNFGLIPIVADRFRKLIPRDTGYSQNFSEFLQLLATDVTVRDKLASFPRPKKGNSIGKNLIRISLRLSKKRKIHSVDAKRTALMACLSYPRQESAGNCFALSLAIKLYSSDIEKCLDDFREILEYGYLKREVENEKTYFPALLKQPLESVNLPLKGTPEEWKTNPRITRILEFTGKSFPTTLPPKELTVNEFLLLLGKTAHEIGQFMWESDTLNPLIGAWSNSIASMAEGSKEGMVKSALLSSCIHVAKQKVDSDAEIQAFEKKILKRVHFHYDPSVQSTNNNHGAFVMYDRKKNYKRIDSEKKFHTLMISCVKTGDLSRWISEKAALEQIVDVYDDNEKPWLTKFGNDPKALIKTYKNGSSLTVDLTFSPKDVRELYDQILEHGSRQLSQKPSRHSVRSTVKVLARIVGAHTFNLIVNHTSMVNCLVQGKDAYLEVLKETARTTAHKNVPKEMYTMTLDYFISKAPELKAKLSEIPEDIKIINLREWLIPYFKPEIVDFKLFQFLPAEMKFDLESSAIHFADTNGENEGYDIHWAFAVNPLTMQLEIFLAEDRGRLLTPLNKGYKTCGVTWEVLSS